MGAALWFYVTVTAGYPLVALRGRPSKRKYAKAISVVHEPRRKALRSATVRVISTRTGGRREPGLLHIDRGGAKGMGMPVSVSPPRTRPKRARWRNSH